MLEWSIKKMTLPLRASWGISRYETKVKENFFVQVKGMDCSGMGEVAFNERYGESEETIFDAFENFLSLRPQVDTLNDLQKIFNCIDMPSSLKFGIESAYVHYLTSAVETPIHQLLGINQVMNVPTSYSIPLVKDIGASDYFKCENLNRFDALKIKVCEDSLVERVSAISKVFDGKIRIDANESYSDPDLLLSDLEVISRKAQIEFIEQPFSAHLHEEQIYFKKHTSEIVIGDESITDGEISSQHLKQFHGLNIKLMKAGGYINALRQIRECKKIGLKVMLGCMIETSLGISSAMNISHGVDFIDLDGSLYLQKDPFNLLYEENGRLKFSNLH